MQTFQELIEEAGHETRSYSGRAMYGKQCLGVETSDIGTLVADVFQAIADSDGGEGTLRDLAAMAEQGFRGLRTDSMGMDIIVYFPGVPYESEPSEDEDEDELQDSV
ncbi:MAG TPA: hypothetical protein VIE65_04225 [Methylobacter sp.]|jgi:hypothetical protein